MTLNCPVLPTRKEKMKLITRDTDYALRALCFIARNKNRIVPVSELVRELNIPRPFLRKILQVLNKKNILNSRKGPSGGFLLALPAKKIFLIDLINIFHGPLHLNDCLLQKIGCPNTHTCVLRRKISKIEHYVLKEIGLITIASLLK
jgi:Rrf2 family protein